MKVIKRNNPITKIQIKIMTMITHCKTNIWMAKKWMLVMYSPMLVRSQVKIPRLSNQNHRMILNQNLNQNLMLKSWSKNSIRKNNKNLKMIKDLLHNLWLSNKHKLAHLQSLNLDKSCRGQMKLKDNMRHSRRKLPRLRLSKERMMKKTRSKH